MANKTPKLPKSVQSRLQPFIDKGVQNGIFADEQPVALMFKRKAQELKDTVAELGGIRTTNAQRFVANCVMTDLSAMLRQKSYTAHMEVWKVESRMTRTGRAMANLFGSVVVEDGDSTMAPALFKMGLWDEDASLADDIDMNRTYTAAISCRDLDRDILDLRPLSGMTVFIEEEYEGHGDRVELLRETYEVSPIAELEDSISRNRSDYRLVEATVSYAGVQQAKSGNSFGKMLLKDESTMTIEAIESGENLLLNALCDTDTANTFGKYSEVLALVTTSMSEQYGLSATIECAIGVVTISPPKPEAPAAGDDGQDDASSYFTADEKIEEISLDDDDDKKEVVEEATDSTDASEDPAPADETPVEAKADKPAPKEGEEGWTTGDDDDDEWDDDDWE
tara:strand:+ start:8273 stop:9454 length:1182 start_codon:yes stop_codon:yes gene_type:complete